MPGQFFPIQRYPDRIPSRGYLGYFVDPLCRRDPATGAVLASVTEQLDGLERAVRSVEPDYLIGAWGSASSRLRWQLAPGSDPDTEGDPNTASVTLTFDLGVEYRLAYAWLWLERHDRRPQAVSVWTSTDGESWQTVHDDRPYPETRRRFAFSHAYPIDLEHAPARYLRIKMRGMTGKLMELIRVWINPSVFGEPCTEFGGFPANHLDGVAMIDRSAGWSQTRDGPPQRDSFWRGLPNAATDATHTFDLGSERRLIGLAARMDLREGSDYEFFESYWDFGAKFEVSSDRKTWATIFDEPNPSGEKETAFHGCDLNLALTPITCRYIRMTNYRGDAYAAGRRFGSKDISGYSGTGVGYLGSFVATVGDPDAPATRPIAMLKLAADGPTSVGLFDQHDRPVAELLAAAPLKAGEYPLYWEGQADWGLDAPGAGYTVRALQSEASQAIVTAVGNSGPMGEFPNKRSFIGPEIPAGTAAITVVPNPERILVASVGEENSEVALFDADGTLLTNWNEFYQSFKENYALAADAEFWWRSTRDSDSGRARDTIRLVRHNLSNGVAVTSAVALAGHDTRQASQHWSEIRRSRAIGGLAVEPDGTRLFVADYPNNRIRTWDKLALTEIQAVALAVSCPTGIALDPDGAHLWVAHSGDTVSKHLINADGTLGSPVAKITGLDDPDALATARIDGVGPRLFVMCFASGLGHARLKEYDIAGAQPVNAGTFADFGSDFEPFGPARDEAWLAPRGLAVTSSGDVLVSDAGCRALRRFRYSDGACTGRQIREFGVACHVPHETIDHDAKQFSLLTNINQYRVRVDGGAWTVEEGGLMDGSWRLERTTRPRLTQFYGPNYTFTVERHLELPNGQTRRFYFNNPVKGPSPVGGFSIWVEEDDGARHCGGIHSAWCGVSGFEPERNNVFWSWTDFNGDGQITSTSDGTAPEGEITELIADRILVGNAARWSVDPLDGSIWIPLFNFPLLRPEEQQQNRFHFEGRSVVRIPLAWHDHGDGRYSPIYRWSAAQLVYRGGSSFLAGDIEHERSPDDLNRMAPVEVHRGGNLLVGRHFAAPNVPSPKPLYRALVIDATTGQLRRQILLSPPGNWDVWVRADPLGEYVWEFNTGQAFNVWHYGFGRDLETGLAVWRLGGEIHDLLSNFIDQHGGCWVFIVDGTRYAAVEDNYQGKANIYRLDGPGHIRRTSAALAWPGSLNAWSQSRSGTTEVPILELPAPEPRPEPEPPGTDDDDITITITITITGAGDAAVSVGAPSAST